MALFEATTALAMIYSRFSLRAVPNQTITYQNSLTMPQLRGIRVTVTKRTYRATGRGGAAAAAHPAPIARAGGHALTPDAPESASGRRGGEEEGEKEGEWRRENGGERRCAQTKRMAEKQWGVR